MPFLVANGADESAIVGATWGLVVVTALLVVATVIPFVGELLRRRAERAVVASRAVPDMNILRSRIVGAVDRLGSSDATLQRAIEHQEVLCDKELHMLAPIIEVRDASLKFTNELFLVRHLLTFSRQNLEKAAKVPDTSPAADIRKRDALVGDARRSYMAALLSLDAAEELLPRRERLVDGERFWDRFARVSDERENDAAAALAAARPVSRTSKPRAS
ncbi:hypothetical protein [Pseudolysinimonas sp.]|uniref:hypothetical protein n=1 Tax=Pseudolysinimonas sp. TaxID=2680009 RepID=UPI003784E5F9